MRRILQTLLVSAFGLVGAAAQAAPLTPQWTYQGQLVLNGDVVDGTADVQFQLFNVAVGGVALATSTHLNEPVSGGLFTVDNVDFGSTHYNGIELWVEVAVRVPPGGGAYTILTPRQRLAPTPLSWFSMRPWQTSGNDIFFDGARVGIGTTSPNYRLDVQSTTPRAISAVVTAPTGTTYGVYGQSNSSSGTGVFGAGATGVLGQTSDSSGSAGVRGISTSVSGTTYGVYGEASSSTGRGLYGLATAATGTSYGVYGQADGFSGRGVYGRAPHTTGVNFGVYGESASPNGYGGYFEGRGYFRDSVGIGDFAPLAKLHVVDAGFALGTSALQSDDILVEDTDAVLGLYSQNNGLAGSTLALGHFNGSTFIDKWAITRQSAAQGNGLRLTFGTNDDHSQNSTVAYFDDNGRVGIGTTAPTNDLTVVGTANVTGNTGIGTSAPELRLHVTGGTDAELASGGFIQLGTTANPNMVMDQNEIMARNNGAAATLFLNFEGGNVNLAAAGDTIVRVLQITGADVAERFPTNDKPEPGMVMEIDPDNAGKLRVSRGAYNRRVAGVISGAGDLPVGAVLGNLTAGDNGPPVALSGRVYVQCDASEREIEIGDLLTTAELSGYAMAVRDTDKANGAIIGKAMTKLSRGERGLVLVLVNLQ